VQRAACRKSSEKYHFTVKNHIDNCALLLKNHATDNALQSETLTFIKLKTFYFLLFLGAQGLPVRYVLHLFSIALCLSAKPKIRKLTSYRAKAKTYFLRFCLIQSCDTHRAREIKQRAMLHNQALSPLEISSSKE
jgi:hypothetical protein